MKFHLEMSVTALFHGDPKIHCQPKIHCSEFYRSIFVLHATGCRRIIVPQIAIWLGCAQMHIPCARISSSQPTTSTPQLQHSPPAITGSSAFPPFPTRFAPLHGGVSSMFYFFSNGQFPIGYEYQFLVWTSWFDLPCLLGFDTCQRRVAKF